MAITNIKAIRTGSPTVLLFETGRQRFVHGTGAQDLEQLRRYHDVWQRLSPAQGDQRQHGHAPGLRIRYANDDLSPATSEVELSTVIRTVDLQSDDCTYLAVCHRRGEGTHYGMYGSLNGIPWVFNTATFQQHTVRRIWLDDDRVAYEATDGNIFGWSADSIFDYATGWRIAHHPAFNSIMQPA